MGKDKPAFSTSLMAGTIVLIYAYTYLTLGLFISGIVVGINGLVWSALAFQKYTLNKKQQGLVNQEEVNN